MLAVWVEPWFGLPAGVAGASFLITAAWPSGALPLMSLDSLVLTLVVVLVWFPRQDLERIRERRLAVRSQARQWLVEQRLVEKGRGPALPGKRGEPED